MARGNQTFKAAFLLDAKQFKAGVREIQGSLKSLKGSFMDFSSAIGIGLGLVSFVGNLKETAVKLSVAENTLQNVSRSLRTYKTEVGNVDVVMDNFNNNLRFVQRLAKTYGQDIVALTHEYAQFSAAANGLGISLENQKKIYESLVRVAATFHMSEDKTRDMIVAVTQMMSKGKITAEELRRQLGNHLPGAFNLMAKAAGEAGVTANGTTAELEQMMKEGEALAYVLLPHFADQLNKLTEGAHFESLQMSLNQFKNAWTALVKESGFEGMFTKLVDVGVKSLTFLTNNFKAFVWGAVAAFSTGFVLKITRGFDTLIQKGQDWYETQKMVLRKTEGMAESLKQKLISSGGFQPEMGDMFSVKAGNNDKDLIKNLVKYNEQLIKQQQIKLSLGEIEKSKVSLVKQGIENLREQNKELIENYQLADDIGKGFSGWQKLLKGAGVAIKAVKTTLMSIGITAIITAITSLVVGLVNHFKKIREEIERINSIFSTYEEGVRKTENTVSSQKAQMESLLAIVKDTAKSEKDRQGALDEINKLMNNIDENQLKLSDLKAIENGYDAITAAVQRWCKAEELRAKIQYQANAQAEAESVIETKKDELADLRKQYADAEKKRGKSGYFWADVIDAAGGERVGGTNSKQRKINKQIDNVNKEIAQQQKIVDAATSALKEYNIQLIQIAAPDPNVGKKKKEKLTGLAKVFDDYQKEETALANQLLQGAITQEEYNDAAMKMVQSYYKQAAGTGEISIDKVTEKLQSGKALTKMEEWYYNLAQAAKEAVLRTSLKESNKIIDKALKESDKEWKKYLKEQKDKKAEIEKEIAAGGYSAGGPEERNPLFDYSKSNSEILSEEEKAYRQWYDDVERLYLKLMEDSKDIADSYGPIMDTLDELSQEMEYAKQAADSLAAAMHFAKIQEEIKDVRKEIKSLAYGGVKDFATSLDRVVSAAKTLEETMESTESSGWEKFMAVFNLITQVVDTAIGVYQTITTLQELSNKIGAAKIAEQTALNALLKEELALRLAAQGATDEEIASRLQSMGALIAEKGLLGGILGLKQQEASQTATNTALKGGEAAASLAAAGASSSEAIAGATASGAKMPFPYNLIAIAAGVAAVVAALASMSKFAKGGIVGGNSSHGDRNIARVNSGEMILNKAQQGTLFSMLNGKGGIGGNVEFKIKGSDLVGTINNYGKKISK